MLEDFYWANSQRTRCDMKRRAGTFPEFKAYTLAVARGERKVDPSEPKVWCERVQAGESNKICNSPRSKQAHSCYP